MTRSLIRACLARGCSNVVRGKSYCHDCQRVKDQAKRVRRPDLHNDAAERRRRAAVVADHRSLLGDWCPGWAGQPAHPSADLTADHVREVAAGGRPDGRLVVRCRSCNAARSAHLAHRALAALGAVRSSRLRPIASTAALGPPGQSPEQQSGGALGPGHEGAPDPDLPAAPVLTSGTPHDPAPAEPAITHLDDGPVVA
jgi:5-methylcytosine-specific restriction enzyme A